MDSVVLCVTYRFVRELSELHNEVTKSDHLDLKSEILNAKQHGFVKKRKLDE